MTGLGGARSRLVQVLALSGLAFGLPATAAGIQQAFLVQNSGWMEPFYTDTSSQLKPLVVAVAGAVTRPEDTVFTMAFSQSSGSHSSPELLATSRGPADMARHLDGLDVARKGGGNALADTDFKEAITQTITGPFKAAPGIVWIFTNNKNSPNNDPQTAERNRDFYRLLHLEPSITKTLVFPLKMPVRGKLYSAQGLMVYALAYGQPAANELDRIVAEGRLSKVLTNAPARLKPVDQNAARLLPERVLNSPNVRASLAADRKTVVLDVDAANLVPTVTLRASLENLFYPYAIRKAKVDASLGLGVERTKVAVTPDGVVDLQPGASKSVEVSFTLPMAQVPSPWSPQALAAMGKQIQLPLVVEMQLSDQQLAPSSGFTALLNELFPGDPISELFSPPDSVRASTTKVPLLVRIQYPLTPVLALMGAMLLLVGGLVAGLVAVRSSKRYEVMVDGVKRNFVVKPFSVVSVSDAEGKPVGELKRGLGRPRVVRVVEGRSLSVTNRG